MQEVAADKIHVQDGGVSGKPKASAEKPNGAFNIVLSAAKEAGTRGGQQPTPTSKHGTEKAGKVTATGTPPENTQTSNGVKPVGESVETKTPVQVLPITERLAAKPGSTALFGDGGPEKRVRPAVAETEIIGSKIGVTSVDTPIQPDEHSERTDAKPAAGFEKADGRKTAMPGAAMQPVKVTPPQIKTEDKEGAPASKPAAQTAVKSNVPDDPGHPRNASEPGIGAPTPGAHTDGSVLSNSADDTEQKDVVVPGQAAKSDEAKSRPQKGPVEPQRAGDIAQHNENIDGTSSKSETAASGLRQEQPEKAAPDGAQSKEQPDPEAGHVDRPQSEAAATAPAKSAPPSPVAPDSRGQNHEDAGAVKPSGKAAPVPADIPAINAKTAGSVNPERGPGTEPSLEQEEPPLAAPQEKKAPRGNTAAAEAKAQTDMAAKSAAAPAPQGRAHTTDARAEADPDNPDQQAANAQPIRTQKTGQTASANAQPGAAPQPVAAPHVATPKAMPRVKPGSESTTAVEPLVKSSTAPLADAPVKSKAKTGPEAAKQAATAKQTSGSKPSAPDSPGTQTQAQAAASEPGVPQQGPAPEPVARPVEPGMPQQAGPNSPRADGFALQMQPAAQTTGQPLVSETGTNDPQSAQMPPTVKAGQPETARDLAFQMARQIANGTHQFSIRLDPADLGQIDIQMDVSADGHVKASLSVERPETLDLLRSDARALERALSDAGLKASSTSLDFSLKDRDGQGQNAGGQNAKAGNPYQDYRLEEEEPHPIPSGSMAAAGQWDDFYGLKITRPRGVNVHA